MCVFIYVGVCFFAPFYSSLRFVFVEKVWSLRTGPSPCKPVVKFPQFPKEPMERAGQKKAIHKNDSAVYFYSALIAIKTFFLLLGRVHSGPAIGELDRHNVEWKTIRSVSFASFSLAVHFHSPLHKNH